MKMPADLQANRKTSIKHRCEFSSISVILFYMFVKTFLQALNTGTFLINMQLPEYILKLAQYQTKIKVSLYIEGGHN